MRRFTHALLLLLVVFVAAAGSVGADDPFKQVCSNPQAKASPACQSTGSNPLTGPGGVLVSATHIIAIIAGAAAVIVIMVSSLQYITSNGDAKKVSEAKNTILYAAIGIVVIVVAQTIISFVLSKI